ncbi:hypothetical protein [Paracoccus sp. S-4012]|uniref:hypothetical protein n=1 Tax=Paracoccus sp. S-4012 TaxID=2665648 RepID=UPI00351B1B34
MTGANSAVGLRSTPARYIFLERGRCLSGFGRRGRRSGHAGRSRSLTFAHRRTVLLVSTAFDRRSHSINAGTGPEGRLTDRHCLSPQTQTAAIGQ